MSTRKKLIEVALPLEAINRESALRKRKAPAGYPTTLHKWWAQRPIAACRAVLFASIVDDPSSQPEKFPTEETQLAERVRLFSLLEDLIKWENSTNEEVLTKARVEIRKSTEGNPPAVLDPFCGGGSIPLEAQRLGLNVHASDLNPVAVLITKALVEIATRFAGSAPVNPESGSRVLPESSAYRAQGLAEDVRYYGKWMRDEAERRIGHLYPKVKLPKEYGGGAATAIAWLWARTVKCPNPACGAQMALISTFWLSTNPKKKAWIEPVVDRQAKTVRFEVKTGGGQPLEPPKTGRGAKFRCLVCNQVADDQHIKNEGTAKRMGAQLMTIVAEAPRGRIYVAPRDADVAAAELAHPTWAPEEELGHDPRAIWCTLYGLTRFRDLFTERQLVALTTITDLVSEAREQVIHAAGSKLPRDDRGFDEGGAGARAYADVVATYLACAVSRAADYGSALASWRPKDSAMRSALAKQALPMIWDFAEGNPFASSSSGFLECVEVVVRCVGTLPTTGQASVRQIDATTSFDGVSGALLVCTDPPYYDNIGYADLADFFYVWIRRPLSSIYRDLFSTLLTPKAQELIATPYRFEGDRARAEKFFEAGLGRVFERIRREASADYPVTVFYAFKQAETAKDDGSHAVIASTGWETMLEALIRSGLMVSGTWPMRTEGDNRQVGVGANVLASSIVLVCRPRATNAGLATRREFVTALKAELPYALKNLQHGNIAPVDLAQASIGPGMAVFSRFAKVLEADGTPMRVRTALGLINQLLDEALTEQDSEYDPATRWALAWFEQHGMDEGKYGDAETLSKAKNVGVEGLVEDGFLWSRRGKVRLLSRDELDGKWDPRLDERLTVWEVTQHLVHHLDKEGEASAAGLLRKLGSVGEVARDLAYRLYSTSERKGWARDALAYNSLVVAWPQVARMAAGTADSRLEQTTLLSEA